MTLAANSAMDRRDDLSVIFLVRRGCVGAGIWEVDSIAATVERRRKAVLFSALENQGRWWQWPVNIVAGVSACSDRLGEVSVVHTSF